MHYMLGESQCLCVIEKQDWGEEGAQAHWAWLGPNLFMDGKYRVLINGIDRAQ